MARKSDSPACIYALKDSSGVIRYIGKANDPEKRLDGHMRERKRDYPVYRWLRKNGRPTLEVLEVCEGDWRPREKFWIAKYRQESKLLNVADGGDQPFCPRDVLAENGRRAARARCATPLKKFFYDFNRTMCQNLKRGWVSETTKDKLRVGLANHPDLFTPLRKWL